MSKLIALLAEHGIGIVFLNVLLVQLGAPVPAVPTLVVTGALAADGRLGFAEVLAAAFAASMIADVAWYYAGVRFGRGVLSTMCRVSLSPDGCVRQTESVFERHGARALVAAKFVPGLSTIAPPLAGALGYGLAPFLLFDAIGTLIWAGAAVGAGAAFSDQIDAVLDWLSRMGGWAALVLGSALALFALAKWWERRKLARLFDLLRIGVDELDALLAGDPAPLILDVRSRTSRELDPRAIPGAIAVDLSDIDGWAPTLPRDREVVVYCACPSEASAALVARRLLAHGFKRVRPLAGGIDAWAAAGRDTGVGTVVAAPPRAART